MQTPGLSPTLRPDLGTAKNTRLNFSKAYSFDTSKSFHGTFWKDNLHLLHLATHRIAAATSWIELPEALQDAGIDELDGLLAVQMGAFEHIDVQDVQDLRDFDELRAEIDGLGYHHEDSALYNLAGTICKLGTGELLPPVDAEQHDDLDTGLDQALAPWKILELAGVDVELELHLEDIDTLQRHHDHLEHLEQLVDLRLLLPISGAQELAREDLPTGSLPVELQLRRTPRDRAQALRHPDVQDAIQDATPRALDLLAALHREGSLTYQEAAQELDLSRPSVSTNYAPALLEHGLAEVDVGKRGRKRLTLTKKGRYVGRFLDRVRNRAPRHRSSRQTTVFRRILDRYGKPPPLLKGLCELSHSFFRDFGTVSR